MDELRESSLLFSLEGLMETERERVQREAREAQARREAEIRRVAEAAERRSQQARQEREERERREALAQERDRLEHERLEALKLATVERARIEAESGLRLVEAEQARQHALSLSRIREEQGAARYRALSWLSSGAFVLLLLCASGAYFAWLAPAHAGERQHFESLLSESRAKIAAAELLVRTERSRRDALAAELARACTPAPSSAAPSVAAPPPAAKPIITNRPRPPAQTRPACRDSGDPLDNCIR